MKLIFVMAIFLLGVLIVSCSRPSTSFTLMEFNIEDGGVLVSLDKVIEAIHTVNPDVVAIEEANGNMALLAEKLGWPYYDERHQILSRHPLIDPSEGQGVYLFVEVAPNKVIAISNLHLPSDPYGPEKLQLGMSAKNVLEIETSLRLPAIKQQLDLLPNLAKAGIPVFLTGDFNAPSHLDWQTPGKRYLIWPVSKALADAGFQDAYREVYPDVLSHPGFTWFADRPKVSGWNPSTEDLQERIDFIYVAGPAKTLKADIVGEINKPEVTYSVSPWPSDHRAIAACFALKPATPPNYIAVNKRKIIPGETLQVRYHAPGKSGEKVAVSVADVADIACQNNKDGHASFSTENWRPGNYEVMLKDAKNRILSRTNFYVKSHHSVTKLVLDKESYHPGEAIHVQWENAPGNRFDWIIIKPKYSALNEKNILLSTKTHAHIDGNYTFLSEKHHLPRGHYEILYMIDDGFEVAEKVSFTIS
ncbi:MAG: endonuclease/exonuclease/phosphatase family protein [Pseudomonadota bacterium]|nr:endonuclease/exonuclease/phosphatase family protein [Pseudomonadota bacterium]